MPDEESSMKVKVVEGSATITADIPVFIGATGDGQFPLPGERMLDFWFQPKKDTCGYLVFDQKEEARRTPISPTFVHYNWNAGGKLIVDEGLKLERSVHVCSFKPDSGLTYHYRGGRHWTIYCTGMSCAKNLVKKVGVLDLLRFIEDRITIEQLDKLVIQE
jgi:hypothetical protein